VTEVAGSFPEHIRASKMLKMTSVLSLACELGPLSDYKLHLAGSNGEEDPLQVFLAGTFQEWQSWQTRENFKRKLILSLVKLPADNSWLFVGIFRSDGYVNEFNTEENRDLLHYSTQALEDYDDLSGRLIVSFNRKGRNSYRLLEKWDEEIFVSALRDQPLEYGEFPGFGNFKLSMKDLEIVIGQRLSTWKGALSSVAGIYLITDTTNGRQYVGMASGKGGFWQRWTEYYETGHGNNKALKALLRSKGKTYARNFLFSILEVADTGLAIESLSDRESHWKEILCSRTFGYNEN
jgi:hypothetical protein